MLDVMSIAMKLLLVDMSIDMSTEGIYSTQRDQRIPEGLEGTMQPRRDSEKLNPLQILLMVFVKFGLATPYDLMSLAGMSVGLTSPTLKRLEESGALRSEEHTSE